MYNALDNEKGVWAFAVTGLTGLLNFLKNLFSGPAYMGFELDSNNGMTQACKGGGNAVANWVHGKGVILAEKLGIADPVRVQFASEIWGALFSKFRANQHWELDIPSQFQPACVDMLAVMEKYAPGQYDPDAFATYLIDLGGNSQFHFSKGSGRTKIQWRKNANDVKDKVIAMFGGSKDPPPPPPKPTEAQVRDAWAQAFDSKPPVPNLDLAWGLAVTDPGGNEKWPLTQLTNHWKGQAGKFYGVTNKYSSVDFVDAYEAWRALIWDEVKLDTWFASKGAKGGGAIQAGFGVLPIILILGAGAYMLFGKKGKVNIG